jgi:cytochrome c biogenesis protein CcdA
MKRTAKHIGITFIIIGALTLTATRLTALNGNNALLLTGLLLIILGIVLHIRSIKRESGY